MPTTSVSRTIAAPQHRVWAALADIANAGRWNTAWTSIEISSSPQGGLGTTFRAHTADGSAFDFEVTEWLAPEYIAFGPIRRDEERYSLTLESHAFRLRPTGDDHTHVELIAKVSAHGIRGWFYGLFFWRGHQKQGLNIALDGLQAVFEPPERNDPQPGAETSSTTD